MSRINISVVFVSFSVAGRKFSISFSIGRWLANEILKLRCSVFYN